MVALTIRAVLSGFAALLVPVASSRERPPTQGTSDRIEVLNACHAARAEDTPRIRTATE